MKKTRLITVIISFIMLFEIIPVNAAKKTQSVFMIKENFNSGITNEKPQTGDFVAYDTHVFERVPGADKAVSFQTLDGFAQMDVKGTSNTDKFVFSMDCMVSGGRPFIDLTINQKTFLNVTDNGTITTYDGYPISARMPLDKYKNIALEIDGANKMYSIYVDGGCVVSQWYMKDMAIKEENKISIRFMTEGEESDITIDNLFMYEGFYRDMKPFTKGGYSADSIEYIPEDMPESGTQVYVNTDFEGDEVQEISLFPKDNKITLEKKSDNQYLLYKRAGSQDFYAEKSFSDISNYLIIQADYLLPAENSVLIYLEVKDLQSKSRSIAKIGSGISVGSVGGGAVSSSKWTNVAVVINIIRSVASVYVDGVKTIENISVADGTLNGITTVRFWCDTGTSGATIMQDNLRIYEGKEPRELGENEQALRRSQFTEDSVSQKKLRNTVALHDRGDSIFYDNEKHKMATTPYYQGEELMVPLNALADAYKINASFDESTGVINLDGKAEMTIGAKTIKINGEEKAINAAPEVKNDVLMVPMQAVCGEYLRKQITYYEHGLHVMSNLKWSLSETEMQEVNNYILFDRPKAEQLLEFTQENALQRPRVMLNPTSKQNIVNSYRNKTNENIVRWGNSVIEMANTIGPETVRYELPDNYRLLAMARSLVGRSMNLSMAYLLTGDTKYSDRLWTELEAAGNFPDWNPQHYLDVSEMTVGFAVAYDWLYDVWTPEQRSFLEKCIYEKNLVVTDKGQHGEEPVGGWWVNQENNWNAVCNSGAILGAAAVFETYPELSSLVIQNSVRGLESMMKGFYPLGAWEEGGTYWEYLMVYFVYLCDTLENCFGSTFNILNAPGLNSTVNFSVYSAGFATSDNFHDAETSSGAHASHYWLAKKYNQPQFAKLRMQNTGGSGGILDLLWFDTETELTNIDLPLDTCLISENLDYSSMRGSWTNTNSPYLSFHCGKARVEHGHLDLGTYVIDMLGERWAIDIGGDDYNLPGYFGSDQRYDYYRLRPEGHNVYVINPDSTPGQNLNASTHVYRSEFKDRGAFVINDLSEAYNANASSAMRGYMLADERRSVIIRDEISLKKLSDVYWFSHTKADIEIIDNNTAILTQGGEKVKLSFVTNAEDFELSIMDAVPLPTSPNPSGQAQNSGIKKICAKATGNGDLYIQARWIPLNDPNADKEQENVALVNWKVSDGERRELPTLDTIYMDGIPMTGFEPTKVNYSFTMPREAVTVPQISAYSTEAYTVEVYNVDSPGKNAKVKVIDNQRPENYSIYSIDFPYVKKLDDVGGRVRIPVFSTVASDEPEKDNIAPNVNDGTLATRWAASGSGQWVTLDLGSPQQITAIGVAGWKGGERKYFFDIAVSNDNTEWTTVLTGGETSGKSENIEIFEISPVNARYVRLIGNKNSQNDWNSILEFAALQ